MSDFNFNNFISIVKKPVIIAVILNIVLPMIVSTLATKEEIKLESSPPESKQPTSLSDIILFLTDSVKRNLMLSQASFSGVGMTGLCSML